MARLNPVATTLGGVAGTMVLLYKLCATPRAGFAPAPPTRPYRGALRVEIVPLELLDDKRWRLQLENGKEEVKEGQFSAVVTGDGPRAGHLQASRRSAEEG